MVRSDLVRMLVVSHPHLAKTDVSKILHVIFGRMQEALMRDDFIALRGFGGFGTKHREKRMARNPKSGVSVSVPARRVVFFRPSSQLLDDGERG